MAKPIWPEVLPCPRPAKRERNVARLSEREQLFEALAQVILTVWEGLDHARRLRVLRGEPIGPAD